MHAQAVLAPLGHEAQASAARIQQNIQLLEGLVGWISLQLPALQSVSPEAALSISSGLDALTTSLHSALAADLSSQTQQMASGLVLGMQQLVATLKLQEGASSITAMAAAQEAMAGTFTVRQMRGCCRPGVVGCQAREGVGVSGQSSIAPRCCWEHGASACATHAYGGPIMSSVQHVCWVALHGLGTQVFGGGGGPGRPLFLGMLGTVCVHALPHLPLELCLAALGVAQAGSSLEPVTTVALMLVALMAATLPRGTSLKEAAAAEAAALSSGSGPDEVPLRYDPAALAAYWSKRPMQVRGCTAGWLKGVSGTAFTKRHGVPQTRLPSHGLECTASVHHQMLLLVRQAAAAKALRRACVPTEQVSRPCTPLCTSPHRCCAHGACWCVIR
jgi:hypothetical protein